VKKYYDLVDLLVYARHSMRLTELVTPLKPLEAMAQGTVFVASDVGGHRELVKDGETGFLFKAGDARSLAAAVDRVLSEHETRERVRANARRFVERERTWAASVGHYAEVFERLALLSPGKGGERPA
jgi:glycosyltransferase involved in cell wall biosynthesis